MFLLLVKSGRNTLLEELRATKAAKLHNKWCTQPYPRYSQTPLKVVAKTVKLISTKIIFLKEVYTPLPRETLIGSTEPVFDPLIKTPIGYKYIFFRKAKTIRLCDAFCTLFIGKFSRYILRFNSALTYVALFKYDSGTSKGEMVDNVSKFTIHFRGYILCTQRIWRVNYQFNSHRSPILFQKSRQQSSVTGLPC